MRPDETPEQYQQRAARVYAASMVRFYLSIQAEYMTQRKIQHDGPVEAKHWRNVNRRLAAKYMVKAWLLR